MLKIDTTSYRTSKSFNQRVRFLVIHYTDQNFATSIQSLTNGAVSSHYLIPALQDSTYQEAGFNELRIFSLVAEKDRAWHAGISHWAGRDNLNDTSIGIEIVNLPTHTNGDLVFHPYEPEQIEALQQLAESIVQRYPDISPTNVVGHSDIAYLRKSDPGPSFPWKALYDAGIGAWYDDGTRAKYEEQFNAKGLPPLSDIVDAFKKYGYLCPSQASNTQKCTTQTTLTPMQLLIRAFQMHFRPQDYQKGKLDAETCAILYALNDKYRS